MPDSRTYAEQCVKSLLGKPLVNQLLERKVTVFEKVPLVWSSGGLGVSDDKQGFRIYLSDQTMDRPTTSDDCFTFSHELAHTFLYDIHGLEYLPHTDPKKHDGPDKDDNQILNCVEDFADEFGYIWLSYSAQRKELDSFLEKYREECLVDITTLLDR